ncbi:glycosyltransferase family 61 protein [Neptunicella sp.]|uniref:glycosyltransferase family 61 protein n=1 Tax=Neptunicella sp. TaxID=2125986 RepID=UPI003F68D0CB
MHESVQFDSDLRADFEILDSLAEKYYHDVIFDPRYCALYDNNGSLIEETILIRGQNEKASSPPNKIPLKKNLQGIQKAIFINSFGYHHYGHFITEQISKLWYLEKSNLPIIFHNNAPKQTQILHKNFNSIPVYQRIFINNLNFCKPENFLFLNKQVKIEQVVVPESSFTIRKSIHSQHGITCRNMAKNILSKQRSKQLYSNKVYLSRSALHSSKRIVKDEKELEILLEKAGFTIHHPEKMSLAEQIQLVNSAEFIVGTIGSALHSILFSYSNNVQLITLSNKNINTNFFMIDAISGIKNTYIDCLSHFAKANENVELDVPKAFECIMKIVKCDIS